MSKNKKTDITEPVEPQQAPIDPQDKRAADTIGQLQQLLDDLPSDQRERLERSFGVTLPRGDVEAAARGHYKYGVRCTDCNHIALYFVGDEWELPDGRIVDLPPPVHHSQVAWTQDLPAEQINRVTPVCQHCGVKVALDGSGAFRRDRGRIVECNVWKDSRDRATDPKVLRQFKKDVAAGKGATEEGGLPSNYNLKDGPVSKVIEQQRGEGSLAELQHVADQTGATDLLRQIAR